MTPRRILLLMGGLFAFGVVYAIYARAFGWLDGLARPPGPRCWSRATTSYPSADRPTSPTIELLKAGVRRNSPETESAFYPTQLEFRNGETSLVLACGQPAEQTRTRTASRSPRSASPSSASRAGAPAATGRGQRDHHLPRGQGGAGVRPHDQTPADMNTAKLIRLELISDPEQAHPRPAQAPRDSPHHQQPAVGRPEPVPRAQDGRPGVLPRPKYATGPDHSGRTSGPTLRSRSWTVATCRASPAPHAATAPAASEESPQSAPSVAAILGGQRFRRRPSPRSGCGFTSTPTTTRRRTTAAQGPGQDRSQEGVRGLQRRPPRGVARKGAAAPVGRGRAGDARRRRGEVRRSPSRRRAAVAVAGGLRPGASRGARARPRPAPGRDPRPVRLRRREEPRPVRRPSAGRPEPAERRPGDQGPAAARDAEPVQPGAGNRVQRLADRATRRRAASRPRQARDRDSRRRRPAIQATPRLDLHPRPLPDGLLRRRSAGRPTGKTSSTSRPRRRRL